MSELSAPEVDVLKKLKFDFPYFSKEALRIRTKSGDIIPFKLNRAQMFLHERLEDMRKRKGKIRAIVCKGRQMGISTYTEARYYHKLWGTNRSMKAFILTHSDKATDTLFELAKNFHQYHAVVGQPPLKTANAKELRFAHNDCSYTIGTAGSKEVGRGSTFQLFHGSEVAFWQNADNHVAASAQAVGDVDGTEIILESTAEGIGNLFYRYTMAALRNESDYEVIFLPWFWHDEYEQECPVSFEPTPEWYAYGTQHKLEWPQLYWAYLKNRELANSIGETPDKPCWKFKQEYPATVNEAFQSSGNSFIPPALVMAARKPEEKIIGRGPVILGIDPARSGDKVGIIDRCGRVMGERISERMDPGGSLTFVASQVANIIDRIRPDMVNIDVGGNGAGVYDILRDMGYDRILNAVNFGSRPIGTGPTGDKLYGNRRAEMYDLMREWFVAGDGPVSVPDDDALQSDICGPEWGSGATRYNQANALMLEEKDKIKQRLGASPDLGDAAALTFAVPWDNMSSSNQQVTSVSRPRKRKTGY